MNVKFEILGFGITQKISLLSPGGRGLGEGDKDKMLTPTRTLPHQGGGELLLFSWFVGDQSAMTNLFEL
jgi:hypothetical protein